VVLFFLISGFIISYISESETAPEFAWRRVLRLAPTLIVAILLVGLVQAIAYALGVGPLLGTDNTRPIGPIDYLTNMALLNWIVHSPYLLSTTWSLVTEVLFYAMTWACMVLMTKSSPVRITIAMMAFSIAIVAPFALSERIAGLCYFTIYLPLLIVGRIFYLNWSRRLAVDQTLALCGLNLLIMWCLYSARFPELIATPGANPFVTYLGATLAVYCLMSFGPRRTPRPIAFLADISYALYLVHLPIGMFVLSALSPTGLPFGIIWAAAVAASIGMASIIARYLEAPIRRLARRQTVMASAAMIN
jgi:peptidoglycan/LPS O-acetylase OafA/YrhL